MDTLVIFSGDKSKSTYRLISFYVGSELYRITTNRFDLKTSEVIMLYAYRWQVELFFRCIKRTLNALHLWNHEPEGVKIQFYIYLIVYVLLVSFKQTLIKNQENMNQPTSMVSSSSKKDLPLQKKGEARLPTYGLVSLLGSKLKKLWKISIHWLSCIKNLLLHPMTDENQEIILSIQ